VREDQKRRIIAAGKSLHSVNKEIEFFLTERENPFDFISKSFGEHKPSVTNYWSTEVWNILKKVMPDEDWTCSDAERRLQIICVDKRRNYQLAIRKAGKTARIAAGIQSAPMG
jgi:PAB1-binding protein PBP1